jgi:hypothetical protein
MGQPITVTEKPTRREGIVRFELNRSLTGMGHEHYGSADAATGDRPPDDLARRLFEHQAVKSVHVYSNEVTVELQPGQSSDGLKEAIEGLYIHYRPGVTPSILPDPSE